MKIGMICPYSFDIPGGVQAHVMELAQVFINRGHTVSVLAPAGRGRPSCPDYVVSVGEALAIPYNGSVARLNFSPKAYGRLRSWLREEEFDVLHVHEPNSPSISMLSLMVAQGPIVTTFHAATTKSLWLSLFQGILRPYHERIAGKIAVSELARRWQMESLGSDAVEIPNGVHVAVLLRRRAVRGLSAPGQDDPVPRPLRRTPQGDGRPDSVRFPRWSPGTRTSRSWWSAAVTNAPCAARPGSSRSIWCSSVRSTTRPRPAHCGRPTCTAHPTWAARVSASCWSRRWPPARPSSRANSTRSAGSSTTDVPGVLVEVGDSEELAFGIIAALGDDASRCAMVERAEQRAARYDWSQVADQILRVYDTVTVGGRQGGSRRMTISALTILILGIVAVVVLAGLGWAYKTANRLDRLHVRVDLSWQALDAALARRAVVARSIGAGLGGDGKTADRGGGPRRRCTGRRTRRRRERGVRRARAGRQRVAALATGHRTRRRRDPGDDRPAVLQRRRPRHPRVAEPAPGAVATPRRYRPGPDVLRDRRARGGLSRDAPASERAGRPLGTMPTPKSLGHTLECPGLFVTV